MREMMTEKGLIAILEDKSIKINNGAEFLETAVLTQADTLAINEENLPKDFFNLKTGIAGDILQKVSNYRMRLIILGDLRKSILKA